MFSRSGFLFLSPLGATPKLILLGDTRGDLRLLIAAIEHSLPKAVVQQCLLDVHFLFEASEFVRPTIGIAVPSMRCETWIAKLSVLMS